MNSVLTTKFVNNTLSLRTAIPFTEENLHVLHLLCAMRSCRSEKYPDRASFTAALSNAYAASLRFNLNAYGPNLMLGITLIYLREDLVQEEGYEQAITDLLDQALHHPVLDQEKLDEARFEILSRLQAMLENPDAAATLKAAELAAPGTTLSIPIQGTPEGYAAVTLEQVQALSDAISAASFEIYACGQPEQEVLAYLDSLPQVQMSKPEHAILAQGNCSSAEVHRDVDAMSLTQIYADGTEPDSDQWPAVLLMNAMLGASSTSLLFETVREKHSLCYSIGSSLIRFEGALVVSAQILPGSLEKVQQLIAEQIDVLKNNAFDQALMDNARLGLINGYAEEQDRAGYLIQEQFLSSYLHQPQTAEVMKQKIRDVTREQVAEAAGRLCLRSWCVACAPSAAPSQAEQTTEPEDTEGEAAA